MTTKKRQPILVSDPNALSGDDKLGLAIFGPDYLTQTSATPSQKAERQ